MKLLTDPIMWIYIVLVSVSVCKVLEKEDVEKAKMRFITLTFLLGVCESLRENNLAILVAIVMAICLYTCWVKRQERIKKTRKHTRYDKRIARVG